MSSYLSLTDLFVVGLALDITGAILLAKGLLISPKAISWVAGTYWGLNEGALLDRCQNRVYGEFGVVYLGLGFLFQAVGYSLEIGGDSVSTGGPRLLVALAMAAVAVALAVAVFVTAHGPRERRLVAAVYREVELRKAVNDDG